MGEIVKPCKELNTLATGKVPVGLGSGQFSSWPPSVEWSERHDDLIVATPYGHGAIRQATIDARTALEEAALAAAEAAAHARSVAEALDDALAKLGESSRSDRSQAGAGALRLVDLSPREKEVLALVAEGRSNRAIADALFVSPNTVKTHVASLLNKLNAHTRAQLAVVAARQELRFPGVGTS